MKVIALIFILSFPLSAFAQWSPPVRISETPISYTSRIVAQGDTLHVVFISLYPGIGTGIGYLRSTDVGHSWAAQLELSDTAIINSNSDPSILVHGSDLMVVFKADLYPSFYRYNIAYCISHDYGTTWSQPAYIFSRNWDLIGTVNATNLNSLINVVFAANLNSVLAYFTIRSPDFGTTWSDTLRLFVVEGSNKPDQAAGNGMIHYAWGGRFVFGDPYDVYYIRSTDGGMSWSENAPLSEIDSHSSQLPALAVDESGNPAISWADHKYSPYFFTDDILARWSFDGGIAWGRENQVTQDHFADFSDICWVQDTIRVVWVDWRFAGGTTIYHSWAIDTIGVWSPEERLEFDPDWSWEPAMAVSNGRVYVVWDGAIEESGLYFTRCPAGPDAVEEENEVVKPDMNYLAAYPNPFNSSTFITYAGAAEGCGLGIYDIQGQLVKTIKFEGMEGKVEWDGTDYAGNKVSSGVYFSRLQGDGHSRQVKLIYLK